MAKGLEMASKRRLQLIRETTPGTYNPLGLRFLMHSINGSLQPDEQFSKFRPSGYNEDAWNALVRTHSVYSGTIRFDYEQWLPILEMYAGAAKSDTTSTGVRTLEFQVADSGERDAITYTIEDGPKDSCDRCTYGILISLSFGYERMGTDVTGNITILCRKPSATGVPMTGATAQNLTQTLVFTNVPEGQGLAFRKAGTVPLSTLFNASDNNATLKSRAEELYGATVTFTGTLTSSTVGGETVYNGTLTVEFSGALSNTSLPALEVISGEVELATISGAFTSGTINGGAVTLADSAATVQAAIRGTGGNRAAVVVKGSSA